jgi:hypothetical protein
MSVTSSSDEAEDEDEEEDRVEPVASCACFALSFLLVLVLPCGSNGRFRFAEIDATGEDTDEEDEDDEEERGDVDDDGEEYEKTGEEGWTDNCPDALLVVNVFAFVCCFTTPQHRRKTRMHSSVVHRMGLCAAHFPQWNGYMKHSYVHDGFPSLSYSACFFINCPFMLHNSGLRNASAFSALSERASMAVRVFFCSHTIA